MSTLTISIIALVAVVVGAVLLFNLWQARGGRRLGSNEDNELPGAFDGPGRQTGRGAADRHPGGEGRADSRRRQPGADDNDWARQRREPTLLADDESGPTAALPPEAFPPQATFTPGEAARGFRAGTPRGRREDRLPDLQEDLGPPQFEVPHLDPWRLELPHPEPDRVADAASGQRPSRGQPPVAGPRAGSGDRGDALRAGSAGDAATDVAGDAGQGASESGARAAGESGARALGESGARALGESGARAAGENGARAAGAPAAGEGPAVHVPAEVDHAVTLIPRTPVNAERLIALTSSLRHVGCKAVRIEIDGEQGTWVPLQSGSMVGRLRCSVLLANRQGPLNAVELSDFSAAVEALAGQIGARFTPPEMNQVMRRARELDAVAARLDTQVDLGVEASAPVTAQKLASIARKLDLFERGGGRFACFADGGELLYTLSAGESSDLLAFVLDVPRTAEEHEPWRSMVACASSCAQLVGGRVIDSTGRGMSVGMIDSVGVQIHRRYRELADAGLRAGSQAALRVFN